MNIGLLLQFIVTADMNFQISDSLQWLHGSAPLSAVIEGQGIGDRVVESSTSFKILPARPRENWSPCDDELNLIFSTLQ